MWLISEMSSGDLLATVLYAVVCIVIVFCLKNVLIYAARKKRAMGWATEVRRKRHIQFQRIRKKLSTPDGTLMTPARHRIVSLSICQLLDELQEGKILPTE
ncbi:unnamed protein product, partial [Cyprideis torosa]